MILIFLAVKASASKLVSSKYNILENNFRISYLFPSSWKFCELFSNTYGERRRFGKASQHYRRFTGCLIVWKWSEWMNEYINVHSEAKDSSMLRQPYHNSFSSGQDTTLMTSRLFFKVWFEEKKVSWFAELWDIQQIIQFFLSRPWYSWWILNSYCFIVSCLLSEFCSNIHLNYLIVREEM